MILIRDVTTQECSWLPRDLLAGEEVFEWHGATYGCITPNGIAISLVQGEHPFYEIPLDAV